MTRLPRSNTLDHGAIAPTIVASRTWTAERNAEARREALRRLMAREGLSCTELARRAGFPSPNRLYNFLRGRSLSLSTDTLACILAVLPQANLVELVTPANIDPGPPLIEHDSLQRSSAGTLPSVGDLLPKIDERDRRAVSLLTEADTTSAPIVGIRQCIQRIEEELGLLKRLLAGIE